jgi:hypothetical protein
MSRQLLVALAVGVVVIGVALYSTVSINQKHLLTLTGSITDVRAIALTPEASLVILDFEANNPSAVAFEVTGLWVERVEGPAPVPSDMLSKAESARYFEYNKLPQPNPSLGIGDRIKGGETVKRMVAARFDSPVAGLAAGTYRIRFRHIENVDAQIEGRKP